MAYGVQQIIKNSQIPANIRVTVRGSVQAMQSCFRSFGLGLILSTLLVYLILVAQFESFVDPLIILLAVPTGLTGVLAILWMTGTTLNVMSLMGVVMMVGIVVSNSILIVEFIRRLRAEGTPLKQAVGLACRVRLRPVLMTSLATLIGLIPMALALGAGSEAYAPLARAIIGGLGVSWWHPQCKSTLFPPLTTSHIGGAKQQRRSAKEFTSIRLKEPCNEKPAHSSCCRFRHVSFRAAAGYPAGAGLNPCWRPSLSPSESPASRCGGVTSSEDPEEHCSWRKRKCLSGAVKAGQSLSVFPHPDRKAILTGFRPRNGR